MDFHCLRILHWCWQRGCSSDCKTTRREGTTAVTKDTKSRKRLKQEANESTHSCLSCISYQRSFFAFPQSETWECSQIYSSLHRLDFHSAFISWSYAILKVVASEETPAQVLGEYPFRCSCFIQQCWNLDSLKVYPLLHFDSLANFLWYFGVSRFWIRCLHSPELYLGQSWMSSLLRSWCFPSTCKACCFSSSCIEFEVAEEIFSAVGKAAMMNFGAATDSAAATASCISNEESCLHFGSQTKSDHC